MSSANAESPAALLRQLFAATLDALEPGPLVAKELLECPMEAEEIAVLALGKAAVPMARAALSSLAGRVSETLVVAPEVPSDMPGTWLASTHPRPSQRSVEAAQALLEAAARAKGEILVLLSGGGSALAALPAQGLSLKDKADLLEAVAAAGVPIDELNLVRKHLSAFKGGRLADAASVPITTLLLSDVVGDRLDTIASGPTLPDDSTFAQALDIVESNLAGASGPAVEYLRGGTRGEHAESPCQSRPGDRQKLLAGMGTLAARAEASARALGLAPRRLAAPLEGRIDSVAEDILSWANAPGLWVACGEATLSLAADVGTGGRAQHLALLLASRIRGPEPVQVLVAGSDGIDGNSEAAGAIVDNTTYERLAALGVSPEDALGRCDSASALACVDAQIRTGPTGVNHGDLFLVYRGA